MSTSAAQTEISSCTPSQWTLLDQTPLTNRTSVEVLNNDTTQSIGIIFTNAGQPPPSGVWRSGRIIPGGGSTKLIPISGSINVYAMTQTGAQTPGAAIVLCEWGG